MRVRHLLVCGVKYRRRVIGRIVPICFAPGRLTLKEQDGVCVFPLPPRVPRGGSPDYCSKRRTMRVELLLECLGDLVFNTTNVQLELLVIACLCR